VCGNIVPGHTYDEYLILSLKLDITQIGLEDGTHHPRLSGYVESVYRVRMFVEVSLAAWRSVGLTCDRALGQAGLNAFSCWLVTMGAYPQQ
jgi:hypothetical protein